MLKLVVVWDGMQHNKGWFSSRTREEMDMEFIGLGLSALLIFWVYSIYKDIGTQVKQNEQMLELLQEINQKLDQK